MRFRIIAVSTALLATTVFAHWIDCGGKALSAQLDVVDHSIHYLHRRVEREVDHAPPNTRYLKPNLCEEVSCLEGTQIRWCNEDKDYGRTMDLVHIIEGAEVLRAEYQEQYKGKTVAGGVLYHEDRWTVIMQQEDECSRVEGYPLIK